MFENVGENALQEFNVRSELALDPIPGESARFGNRYGDSFFCRSPAKSFETRATTAPSVEHQNERNGFCGIVILRHRQVSIPGATQAEGVSSWLGALFWPRGPRPQSCTRRCLGAVSERLGTDYPDGSAQPESYETSSGERVEHA